MKVLYFLTLVSIMVFFSFNGFANESLYKSCKGCHGDDGSKNALGVSNPLKGQSKEEIIQKLNGYKDGTYGGAKKSTMASQAKRLTDADINSLAEYISKF
ncbi:c-type cytochrome [Deferribacteraceae bacterium V6Fe1]|nr:c-type cytochrome [Deferribacteraceae bacterium V6Fe1]